MVSVLLAATAAYAMGLSAGEDMNCKAVVGAGLPDSWCQLNCPDNCPTTLCVCTGPPTPPPAPAPAPPAPAFVNCLDAKNPDLCGDKIWFEDTKMQTRHHVPWCDMCGLNPCEDVHTIPSATLAALASGVEFNCSMIPASSAKYKCIGGNCIPEGTGVSLQECRAMCEQQPTPPPTPTSIPIVDSPLNCSTISSCQGTTVAQEAGGTVPCHGVSSCQGSIFICLPQLDTPPWQPGKNCTRSCHALSACQGDGWLGNWQDE